MDPESSPVPQRGGTVGPGSEPEWLVRLRLAARLDFAPGSRPPSLLMIVAATVASIAGSLAFDELCVHVATSLYPALRGYGHFHFSDYGSLTVLGVLVACAAWPVVTRISSAPRWLFFRSAIVATILLWLPDAWLFVRSEPPRAVAVLMVMHLGIALVTYNLLVHVAPVRAAPGPDVATHLRPEVTEQFVRRLWSAMAIVVVFELVLGVATIVTVPFKRPDTILPTRATWLYAAHGAIGIVLGVGALGVLVVSSVAGRMARIGAVMGAIGVVIGLVGGVLATFQATRLLGMGVMMVGVVLAGIGYMVPSLEAMGKAEAARAASAREALAQSRAAGHATDAEAVSSDRGPSVDRPTVDGHGDLEPFL